MPKKSLAIAYSMKKKMKAGGYAGPHGVKGASTSEDRSRMSGKSGLVRLTTQANLNSKGVNKNDLSWGPSGGQSEAGGHVRHAEYSHPGKSWNVHGGYDAAKEKHKEVLSELKSMPSPDLKAEGGKVDKFHQGANEARKYSSQNEEKGVHAPRMPYPHNKSSFGQSSAGYAVEAGGTGPHAKKEHLQKLDELRSMPNPKLKAEGGEIFPALKGDEGQLKDGYQSPSVCVHCGQPVDPQAEFEPGEDVVSSIMKSRGGEIANEDEPIADEMPAQFDDLVLRDGFEFDGTTENLGDEDDDNDVIKRVMAKRKK